MSASNFEFMVICETSSSRVYIIQSGSTLRTAQRVWKHRSYFGYISFQALMRIHKSECSACSDFYKIPKETRRIKCRSNGIWDLDSHPGQVNWARSPECINEATRGIHFRLFIFYLLLSVFIFGKSTKCRHWEDGQKIEIHLGLPWSSL